MELYIILVLIIIILCIIFYNVYEKFENIIEYHSKKEIKNNYIYNYRIFKLPYRFPFTFKTSFPTKKLITYGNNLIN